MNGKELRKSLTNFEYLYNQAMAIGDYIKVEMLRKEISIIRHQLSQLEKLEEKNKKISSK